MSAHPLRVLCLDIEGGYGGSSRSLLESLTYIRRSDVEAEVWCRRDGPAKARYEALGIRCRIIPGMPKMNSLRRFSRNIHDYGTFLRDFIRWRRQRRELLHAIEAKFDIVHFNHEGLFLLADWLRRRHGKPQTMHVRTMMLDNLFGRWQARRMLQANDHLVFISENERDNVAGLAGQQPKGSVIFNIATPPVTNTQPHPAIVIDGRLRVGVLANYSYMRGVDRVVEVASAVARRGRRDISFVVAGNMRLPRSLPGPLRQIADANGSLADYAKASGVADMIQFLGHVAQPETVLAACDVVIKPTRENNPWGRDILEALAAAKPVISIGHYARFVESGVTGFLLPSYDCDEMADLILRLNDDRGLCRSLGANAGLRVAGLCDGPSRAAELAAVWREAVASRSAKRVA